MGHAKLKAIDELGPENSLGESLSASLCMSLSVDKIDTDRLLSSLLTDINDLLSIKDLKGRYVHLNRKGAEILGRPLDDILGRDDTEFCSPEEAQKIQKLDRAVMQSGKISYQEQTVVLRSKSVVVKSMKAPVFDSHGEVCGVISIARDLTDRQGVEDTLRVEQTKLEQVVEERTRALIESNAALQESERRLQKLFEGIDDAIFVHDQEGNFLDCNQAACRRMEYTKEELLKLNTKDIDAPEFAQGFKHRISRQLDERVLRCEGVHVNKSGKRIEVDIMTSVIEFAGKRAILAAVRDISEHKKAERDRRELERQVQHAQKLESLGILAGGIAHDFNNLLMGVLGSADLALQELGGKSPGYKQVSQIRATAKRARELCLQLLAYSGKGRFIIEPIEINEIVKEMGDLLEISISKKAELQYHLSGDVPTVDADATQIRQVLMNLLTNASDALHDLAGTITIATAVHDCDRKFFEGMYGAEDLPAGQYASLSVTDSGQGMDEGTKCNIFDPFYTTKVSGRGLGLAAVLGIVRGHSGALRVDSELEKGSAFTVFLPVSEKLPCTSSQNDVVAKFGGEGKILLVDDEELVREVAQKMLEKMGFEVLVVEDGEEAIEAFKKQHQEISCVLLDMSMPRLSGRETFLELRNLDPHVRVILSSGYTEQEISAEFAGDNLTGFLQKPYVMQQLSEKLQDALNRD